MSKTYLYLESPNAWFSIMQVAKIRKESKYVKNPSM